VFRDDHGVDVLELKQLTAFVAVAEEQSFTRAAARLGVVQSAVSGAIRGLERELDAPLFERTTHHVRITDAGAALLPEARRTLAAASGAREAVEQVRHGLRGTIVLGTMQAQGMRAVDLPALLVAFRAAHPAVVVRMRYVGSSVPAVDAVRDGSVDLAFTAIAGRPPAGVEVTPLARERMVLVCPPEHPLANRSFVDLADLAHESLIDVPEGWGIRQSIDRAFGAAGIRRAEPFEVGDIASSVDFVRHGLGVAVMPPSTAASDEGIVRVPIRHHAPEFVFSIAAPTTRPLGAASLALLALILASS
jgi:DNA-binding transcriptional LysR family regulator